ncbi:MAG: hypothetical protein A2600_06010 [Candidatus Lambdaproteobacteria bacterium RIFOXYD1_FULL_56_27]|uniref:Uncharacterized protein n=1 Tax=Candidatus Lambdaproteobacteria bacterium RIFOXYD2_FULL_56_26 TaxID=1817773 RepID=A0A1F6GM96_9PROT|nr:MAG: hypothetical protein A2557_10135 [Candidatus Lambdaproteobacteria bacterium RIFOXYD2_FULL_56_26]OGH01763.1 MAG: hypothetical protein A2426_14045 [Candidatus Lambdaproteobacteria bacterium RIFOXYC1_FULL_56_13]OGH07636.1 MAG: hypothetical protein A2600_06010 [Candidatus Lambdaproteobacteria bacterium RIFOXYD1_FULL_56_27]
MLQSQRARAPPKTESGAISKRESKGCKVLGSGNREKKRGPFSESLFLREFYRKTQIFQSNSGLWAGSKGIGGKK